MLSNLHEGMIVEVKIGPITHPGILVTRGLQWGVIHNSLFNKVIFSTLEEFGAGKIVRPTQRYRSEKPSWAIVQDAWAKIGTPWSLNYNCQHFVSDVAGFDPRSHDLEAIWTIAFLTLFGIAVKKSV